MSADASSPLVGSHSRPSDDSKLPTCTIFALEDTNVGQAHEVSVASDSDDASSESCDVFPIEPFRVRRTISRFRHFA